MRLVRALPATAAAFLAFLFVTAASVANAESTGVWTEKSYAIAGGWSIVEESGQRVLLLDESFSTRNAPDLKLFLSPHSVADASDRNATEGAVLLGALESNEGAQRYALPDDVDLSAFESILLHCEAYSKLWGGAPL